MSIVPFLPAEEGDAADPAGGLALLARLIAADLRRPSSVLADDEDNVVPLPPRRRQDRIRCLLVPAEHKTRRA